MKRILTRKSTSWLLAAVLLLTCAGLGVYERHHERHVEDGVQARRSLQESADRHLSVSVLCGIVFTAIEKRPGFPGLFFSSLLPP